MGNFLERMLGGVSTYYDMLMKSRKETSSFSDRDVAFIASELEKITIKAIFYNDLPKQIENASSVADEQIPLDPKLQPLPLILKFSSDGKNYALFCNRDKAVRSDKYHQLIQLDREISPGDALTTKDFIQGESLPIWEELVQRNKPLNDEIKKRAPENPWSLYKASKNKVLLSREYLLQLGGYPQWLINDVDFRKIKKLEFLCELKLSYDCSLFYFLDRDRNELIFYKQKL